MNNLNLDSGIITLTINDDEKRVIKFDPTDVIFAEKFITMIGKFEAKQAEYEARSKEIGKVTGLGKYGLPVNVEERLSLIREVCEYFMVQIDYIFGEGTSKVAFGEKRNLGMIEQFFKGITPFVSKAREKKIKKYTSKPNDGVMK